jgi:putative endonuclease
MTNKYNTTPYTGVTNDLFRRVNERKTGEGSKFTQQYNITKLVFFESTDDNEAAIMREKQIKGGSRQKKIDLVNSINPDWTDLSEFFDISSSLTHQALQNIILVN